MSHSECCSWVNLVDFDPLAALKLTTRSNLVGCSIDRSAGFARHPTLQSPWLASISARTRSTSWAPMSAVRLCAPEMVPWTGGNAPSQYRSGASSRRRRTFPSRRGTADAHLCAKRRRLRHRKGSAGKISPHTLRHTAATWLMQIGVSTWEAAGFLGMSEKTLRDVDGHHHPDYLHRAANAIGTKKPISLVNSLVRPQRRRLQPSQVVENIGGPGRTRTSNQTVMSGRL